jgi:hypothetical protein
MTRMPSILFALFGLEQVVLKGNVYVDAGRFSRFSLYDGFAFPHPPHPGIPRSLVGVDRKGNAAVGSRGAVKLEGDVFVSGPVISAGKLEKKVKQVTDFERRVANMDRFPLEWSFADALPKLKQLLDYVPSPAIPAPLSATNLEAVTHDDLPAGAYICRQVFRAKRIQEPVNVFITDSEDFDKNEPIMVSCPRFFNPPSDLRIWYSGAGTIKVDPTFGEILWGLLYAPNAKVIISDRTAVCGAVVARDVLVENNVRIELDLDLVIRSTYKYQRLLLELGEVFVPSSIESRLVEMLSSFNSRHHSGFAGGALMVMNAICTERRAPSILCLKARIEFLKNNDDCFTEEIADDAHKVSEFANRVHYYGEQFSPAEAQECKSKIMGIVKVLYPRKISP